MPKIRFTESREVRDATGKTVYEAGSVYEMAQSSVDRWVRRGAGAAVSDRANATDPKRYDLAGNPVVPTVADAKAAARGAADEAKAKAAAEAAAHAAAETAEKERLAAEQKAAEAAKLAARSAVKIPDGWVNLHWHEQRALASQLSEDPVKSKEDATAAIEAELKRRVGG